MANLTLQDGSYELAQEPVSRISRPCAYELRFMSLRKKHTTSLCLNPKAKPRHEVIDVKHCSELPGLFRGLRFPLKRKTSSAGWRKDIGDDYFDDKASEEEESDYQGGYLYVVKCFLP